MLAYGVEGDSKFPEGNGVAMSPACGVTGRAKHLTRRAAMRPRRGSVAVAVLLVVSLSAAHADEYLTVTIGSDETIRQVAEKYLSDPDLWPEILRSSGINSIADLTPGMELRVPVNEITAANQALIESLGQIQKANQAGAQIFAPDEIGRALDLHEQALQKRLEREWLATKDLAVASYAQATTAIDISTSQRNQAAEALVSDRSGAVEGQRPEDLSWRDLQLRAILIEEEKVRTLSDSTAQITFRDASRLRLSANSNAIIKEMRFDPLNKTEAAKVSLVEGDFYALLAGGDDRKTFNVEIPQVDAVIDSGNFWVSNDAASAKFTNYDDRTVAVSADGAMVTLGKNEGTIVDRGAKPRSKIAVLPAPAPLAPVNDGVVYVATPELSWLPVDGSAGYWLEIAGDQNFNRIVENGFGIENPAHVTAPLPVGEYFWRVSALDGFGLPGARSDTSSFRVTPDDTPPYLKVEAPADGAILRAAAVGVTGESEPDAKVTVDGAAVDVAADGGFAATVTPAAGANTVTVVATDPAGHTTTGVRNFVFMPDQQSVVAFDPAIRRIAPRDFLTNGDVLSLAGRTTANAAIEIRSGDTVRASAAADGDGVFRVNVPVAADAETLAFAVIAPSGFTTVEDFAVTVDRDAPEIAFDALPPRLTAATGLRIAGATEPGAKLTLNGRAVTLADGRFDETVTLVPGDNPVELIATDAAGNVRIDKSTVRLDQEPPRLVSATGAPALSGGKPVLMVEVVAEDSSGLAKAAPFTVVLGPRSLSGYLRYNKAAKRYQGSLAIPDGDPAAAKLSRVELQDDAGNRKLFDIEQ